MNTFASIRKRLGVTQVAMAEGLQITQGNVSHYEREKNPQTVPPKVARRLIEYAATLGHHVTFDDVYAAGTEQAETAAS